MRPDLDLSVYLVLDPDQCGGHEKCLESAEESLDNGVTIVQLRAPNWHKKALLNLANELVDLCHRFDALFLVNDHVDVALACNADGVHIGQRDLAPEIVRVLIGQNKIIGYSVSSVQEIKDANKLGDLIDYIGAGPVFPTAAATKPDCNPAIGIDGLISLCFLSKYPTVAIGGINLENVEAVLQCGCDGVAVVSAICSAEDKQKATEELVQAFNNFGQKFDKDVLFEKHKVSNILTIAGSDSSGGAGIQADLKTFGSLNAYGLSVLTTITAQNTKEVRATQELDPEFVKVQMDTVFDGCKIDAVKIGVLASLGIVHKVAEMLKKRKPRFVILDPVIVTTSGFKLLPNNALLDLIQKVIPLVTLITPNLPEAAILLDKPIATTEEKMIEQGQRLLEFGPKAVLMKGGHLKGDKCVDFLITPDKIARFEGKRITEYKDGRKIESIHGTGCTLSSAIAVFMAKTNGNLDVSIKMAKDYLTDVISNIDQLDCNKEGPSTLHHFYKKE